MSDLIKTLRQESLQENVEYLDEDYRTQAADLIEQQQARIAELEQENKAAKREALSMVESMYKDFYLKSDGAKLFEPLDTTSGLLTQIDNMYAGIREEYRQLEQVTAERNAVAAHSARLRDYIERGSPYNTNLSKCERKAVLAATPTTSLAEHDAEVARKAILAVTQQPDSIISRLPDAIWISARGVRSFADTYANQLHKGEGDE